MYKRQVLVTMNQKKTWDELSWELELAEPALILNDGVDYGCRDQLEAAYGLSLIHILTMRNFITMWSISS